MRKKDLLISFLILIIILLLVSNMILCIKKSTQSILRLSTYTQLEVSTQLVKVKYLPFLFYSSFLDTFIVTHFILFVKQSFINK